MNTTDCRLKPCSDVSVPTKAKGINQSPAPPVAAATRPARAKRALGHLCRQGLSQAAPCHILVHNKAQQQFQPHVVQKQITHY